MMSIQLTSTAGNVEEKVELYFASAGAGASAPARPVFQLLALNYNRVGCMIRYDGRSHELGEDVQRDQQAKAGGS